MGGIGLQRTTWASGDEVPPEMEQTIDDFDGMAATVRFDDGAVEVEYAVSDSSQT